MKKIIAFFMNIWYFLFGRKEVEIIKPETTSVPVSNHPVIPKHNNRKVTPGRFVQYINVGEGRTRAIYHGSK